MLLRLERIHGRWSLWISRRWNSLSISSFTSSDRFPCTFSHWVFACSLLIPKVKNSLIRCRWRIDYCTVNSFMQLLYLWSEHLYSCVTFFQVMPGEFVNSHFLSSLQFFHFMDISDEFLEVLFLVEPILREVGPALFEILHTHNSCHPFPNDWNELVFEIHECKC